MVHLSKETSSLLYTFGSLDISPEIFTLRERAEEYFRCTGNKGRQSYTLMFVTTRSLAVKAKKKKLELGFECMPGLIYKSIIISSESTALNQQTAEIPVKCI